MDNKPVEKIWFEKYRPKKLEDCILPNNLYTDFDNMIKKGDFPHLLLTGSPGIGKTTVAKILATSLGSDYIVINASKDRNIDTLRHEITNFASSVSLNGKEKVIILDEGDYLNPQSTQPALRGLLEQYANNCRFIFTCNYKNKILEALHSRTSIKSFKIDKEERGKIAVKFLKRICDILDAENIVYDKQSVATLILRHLPDFRRVFNELQDSCSTGVYIHKIDKESNDVQDLVVHLKVKDFTAMKTWVHENIDNDPTYFFNILYTHLYDVMKKESIPQAVVIMADYQYKSAFVINQEINMVSCLTEIMNECRFI